MGKKINHIEKDMGKEGAADKGCEVDKGCATDKGYATDKSCATDKECTNDKDHVKVKNIETILNEGVSIKIKPHGYSMYPMFVPERDEAILVKAEPDKIKRSDVVMYRRDNGMLVLHRVLKRSGDGFYMVGDNQVQVEGPLRTEQILGVLIAFIRNGRYIEVSSPLYWLLSHIWLLMRPIRRPFQLLAAGIKKYVMRE